MGKNNGGFIGRSEWEKMKKLYNYTCPWCGRKEPDIKLTKDHVRPICRGGMSWPYNIQPLCKDCNMLKGKRIIRFNCPVTCVKEKADQ